MTSLFYVFHLFFYFIFSERYCGPVPQIVNGFAVEATNVTYRGVATYQCYAGFAFPSGRVTQSIKCTQSGKWEKLPVCLASSCTPMIETPHAIQTVMNGGDRSYGTVVRFQCEPGYFRTGVPVVVCRSDGTWSDVPPLCSRKLFIKLFLEILVSWRLFIHCNIDFRCKMSHLT